MIGPTTTTAVILRRISVLAMSIMVIRTTTEEAVIIRDTAAYARIGPRSPCDELGWTPGDASTIRTIKTKTIGPALLYCLMLKA